MFGDKAEVKKRKKHFFGLLTSCLVSTLIQQGGADTKNRSRNHAAQAPHRQRCSDMAVNAVPSQQPLLVVGARSQRRQVPGLELEVELVGVERDA